MKYLRYLTLLSVLMLLPAAYAQAQVGVGIGIGAAPGYGPDAAYDDALAESRHLRCGEVVEWR